MHRIRRVFNSVPNAISHTYMPLFCKRIIVQIIWKPNCRLFPMFRKFHQTNAVVKGRGSRSRKMPATIVGRLNGESILKKWMLITISVIGSGLESADLSDSPLSAMRLQLIMLMDCTGRMHPSLHVILCIGFMGTSSKPRLLNMHNFKLTLPLWRIVDW